MKVIGPQPVQGEGDYQAARRHRKSVQNFVQSGKVDKAARKAEPTSEQEGEAMRQAEVTGEARSKGEDPASKHAPARKA